MTITPRRAWCQIHLSTAVVLMFVAGGILYANLRLTRIEEEYEYEGPKFGWAELYGWPQIVYFRVPIYAGSRVWKQVGVREGLVAGAWKFICLNVLIGSVILATCAITIEFVVRRREATP
jgi:hypothetical protein